MFLMKGLRRIPLWSASLFFLAGFSGALAAGPLKNPNVLLITIDTLRYDRVGFLDGAHVKTPHLDDLARRSLVFTRAHAHNCLTRPSHANIMTGTTPLYHGVSDNPGFRLESRYLTLAEYLKDLDYRTAAFIGAFVLDSRFGLDEGFDLYDDANWVEVFGQFDDVERTADEVVRPALKWILAEKDKWFCWVHLFDPHDPYTPPEPYRSEYADDPYSGEVAFTDSQLGVLFEALERNGSLDNTVVILTSDHGEALGEKDETTHGFYAYENSIHIPLFLSFPGVKPGLISENAAHVDIFPTVCDLLGRPSPPHLQGESLLPLAQGKERRNPSIYFESMSPHLSMDCAPLTGFIRGTTKFIDLPIAEVYDLAADPREENNLAPGTDVRRLVKDLDGLKKGLKGKGTTQDLSGKTADIAPLMRSLGYISQAPQRQKKYGPEDDLKSVRPVITHLKMGVAEFRAGQIESAVSKVKTVIRIRPTFVSAYVALAFIHYDQNQFEPALAVLKEGMAKIPDNLQLTLNLGILLIKAKRYQEALEPLEYCVEREPTNPDFYNYLGRAYLETKQLGPARENLIEALKFNPDLVAAYSNLGYVNLILFTQTKNEKYYTESLENFEQALARNPELETARKGKETLLKYKDLF
jgi:arylsulfatase A-like enzyme/Tfp pilus assembly protein PilF